MKREPNIIPADVISAVRASKLVAIHGDNGSGKSYLANELVSAAHGTHIQVDEYLDTPSNGRIYIEQVKVAQLKAAIQNAGAPVLVDCFIVLDVLDRLSMEAEITLYCEKVMPNWLRGNRELLREFEDYKSRHNLPESAKHTFVLQYPDFDEIKWRAV